MPSTKLSSRNHGLRVLGETANLYKIQETEETLNFPETQPDKAILGGELTGQMILTASKATHFKKGQEGTAWEIYQRIMYPGLKKVAMKNIYETIEYGLNI